MKQKHCELIKAWADGAIIQTYEEKIGWYDMPDNSPLWMDHIKYRVKPEVMHVWVALLNGGVVATTHKGEAVGIEGWVSFRRWLVKGEEVEV